MKHLSQATVTRTGRLAVGFGALFVTVGTARAQRPTASRTQPTSAAPAERETGTFHAGGVVFWLRATDAGKVLVYAARGFRTPFAHPSILSADDTDRWAELAASLIAAADGTGPMPLLRSVPSAGGAPAAAVLGGGDLVLDVPDANASPAVNVRVGALGPEALSATLSAAVLREVVPALRESARAARDMAAAHAMAGVAGVARATRALAAAGSALRPSSSPVAGPNVAVPATAPIAAPTAPSVAPAPSLPVVAPRPVVIPAASPVTPVAAPATAPPAPSAHTDAPAIAGAAIAHVAAVAPVTGAVGAMDTARVSVSGLASSVVGNVVRQRQPLLAYCYTAFGLATDSALSGRATMQVALNRTGEVTRADIVDRHWWGKGAERVESCVRQRVMAWRFPAAARATLQDIQLYFNH